MWMIDCVQDGEVRMKMKMTYNAGAAGLYTN